MNYAVLDTSAFLSTEAKLIRELHDNSRSRGQFPRTVNLVETILRQSNLSISESSPAICIPSFISSSVSWMFPCSDVWPLPLGTGEPQLFITCMYVVPRIERWWAFQTLWKKVLMKGIVDLIPQETSKSIDIWWRCPVLSLIIYIAISAQLKIPVWRSVLFYYDIDIA